MKMTQVWKGDVVFPISPMKLENAASSEEFKDGDKLKVTGTTKGHGFQGVVKRYSFRGGPKSHGQKNRLRAPGSIGSTAPQRVLPGRKMAGRMGGARKSIKNLLVVLVDKERGVVSVRGSVPGDVGSKLMLSKLK